MKLVGADGGGRDVDEYLRCIPGGWGEKGMEVVGEAVCICGSAQVVLGVQDEVALVGDDVQIWFGLSKRASESRPRKPPGDVPRRPPNRCGL